MIQVQVLKKLHLPSGDTHLDVIFTLEEGSFVTLYGPSGAGKTTLLKILSGLVRPDKGFIRIGDETWLDTERNQSIPPQQRSVGLVFQDYALFPNLTVKENLAFGLRDKQNKQWVAEIMQLTGLTPLANRLPNTLSGGQQQRVALARTLVRQPKILLLDEPFAALDVQTKSTLREELLRYHQQFNLTTILVSHDPVEIYKLSDYVLELNGGRLARQGKTREIFHSQESSAKLAFYGQVVSITPSDIVYLVQVQVEQTLLNVILTAEEVQGLSAGDVVRITAKAFNPIVTKINQ